MGAGALTGARPRARSRLAPRLFLSLGLESLLLHRLRSTLSVLGVVFGVAAVVAMSSVGEGARREALAVIERHAARMAQEAPGQTLQATALVHEAWLRLVDTTHPQSWNSRGHFFAAAAEAMRRILVEQARRRQSHKGGGRHQHAVEAELVDGAGHRVREHTVATAR